MDAFKNIEIAGIENFNQMSNKEKIDFFSLHSINLFDVGAPDLFSLTLDESGELCAFSLYTDTYITISSLEYLDDGYFLVSSDDYERYDQLSFKAKALVCLGVGGTNVREDKAKKLCILIVSDGDCSISLCEGFYKESSPKEEDEELVEIENINEDEGLRLLLDEGHSLDGCGDVFFKLSSISVPADVKNLNISFFCALFRNHYFDEYQDFKEVLMNSGIRTYSKIMSAILAGGIFVHKETFERKEKLSFYIRRGNDMMNITGFIYSICPSGSLLDSDGNFTNKIHSGIAIVDEEKKRGLARVLLSGFVESNGLSATNLQYSVF